MKPLPLHFTAGFCLLLCLPFGLLRPLEMVDYGDLRVHYYETGESLSGYDSQRSFTVDEKAAAARAVTYLNNSIANTAARDVNVHMIWADGLGVTTLGSSSSSSYILVTPGGYHFMATAAQTVWAYGLNAGNDSSIDCQIILNPSFNFHTGESTSGFSGLDLQSVVSHEVTHNLGFSSSYSNSTDLFGYEYAPGEYAMNVWDHLLEDANGNVPDPGTTGSPGNFNQVDAPVYWTGDSGNAAYRAMNGVSNTAQIPIYAPDPYQSGSSLSHVDARGADGIGGTLDDLTGMMNYSLAPGEVYREFSAVEVGMLEDLDWEMILIPEIGSLFLLVLGLCAAVLVARR